MSLVVLLGCEEADAVVQASDCVAPADDGAHSSIWQVHKSSVPGVQRATPRPARAGGPAATRRVSGWDASEAMTLVGPSHQACTIEARLQLWVSTHPVPSDSQLSPGVGDTSPALSAVGILAHNAPAMFV